MHLVARLWRHLPALLLVGAVIWVQFRLCQLVCRYGALRRSRGWRLAIWGFAAILALWVVLGVVGSYAAYTLGLWSRSTLAWVRGLALAWSLASAGAFAALSLWRRIPKFNQERRDFVRAAGAAFVGAPLAAMTFGILVERREICLREVDVPIPDLPNDLRGLRIVQISDIHLSPFLSERELARAVDMANGVRAHLALVTGDLITSHGDPLDTCLGQLARLRADAGTLGCLGNHEIYARVEEEATRKAARLGIRFLRQESSRLRFGNAALNLTGVDYQPMGANYLRGAERWIVPGETNVLLSHNPDVFDVAARQGWDVTIAGHTHGGQVTVEILHQQLSASRFYTPYVYGLYRQGRSAIWVTRGIGTVGLPARIGAPPEVALIRLCAT
ncbi:MAG: metallophosphoesterase [Bryobacteraceae bacterium]|jgi:predicted MPP superfamily phosphohydrolase